jgi:hypothetical protein
MIMSTDISINTSSLDETNSYISKLIKNLTSQNSLRSRFNTGKTKGFKGKEK